MKATFFGRSMNHFAWLLGATLGLSVFVSASPAAAVGTRRFVLEQGSDFKGGDLTGVAVDSSGRVRVGFDLLHINVEQAPVIWSVLPREDKSYLLGTGQEGKVFEFRGGRVTRTFETGGLVVTSMVEAWGGEVVMSSLPQGMLFKFDGNKLSKFAQLSGIEHIFQLAFDKKRGVLYAATGPEGKLLRIERDGRFDVLFDAPETHLVSLALLPDGGIVVGTSDKAKLYRIDGPGKVTTLYDFGRTEVRAIVSSPSGELFAIANDIKTASTSSSTRTGSSEGSSGSTSASTASAPKAKGRGILLKIGSDSIAEVLLDDDSEHYTSLALGKDGQPYVGTGVEGRVYTVNAQRQSVLVADLDARQVTAMVLNGVNPALFTSDTAGVHELQGQGGKLAMWTSKVLDASIRANFGRIDWESTGALEIMARSGNTKEPDDTWTAWSAPLRAKGRANIASGRYLQLRARFALDKDAILSRVEVPFITDNQRAIVTRVDISSGGLERSSSDGIVSSGGPITGRGNPELNVDWSVDNPDKDTLRYRVFYRVVGSNVWYDMLPCDEVLTKTNFKWDTSTLPEGRYRIKVVASDEPANPPDRVTRHELESGLVTVDNTPPTLVDLERVGKRLRGRAVDGVGPIARIEVSVAGSNEWIPLRPTDSIFDESTEGFDADLGDWLPTGKKIIAVRAYDSANNYVVRHVLSGP
jgi:hypothetical protein